jgi:hypothetical protein
MVKGRSAAAAAVRAINQAPTLLLPSGLCNHGEVLLVAFNCGIGIKASSDPAYQLRQSDMFLTSGKACFRLILYKLENLSWRVNPYEIEAAVALMAWSQRQPLSSLRIIGACVPEDNSFEIPSHHSLQQWECAGTAFHQLVERRLKFSSISTEYATHYNESTDSFRNIIYYPPTTPGMRDSMCGWNAVPWKKLGTPPGFTAYCARVGGFVDLTCAQELYGYFLLKFLRASDNALGETDFVKTDEGHGIRNLKVDKLIDGFIRSGLGTKDDAVRCILPIVAASDCPSPVKDAIDAVLKSVKKAIKSERCGDATSELNWLAKLLVYEADSEHVHQWCLLKTCLYRCDSWEGHAHDGQSFGRSFLKDIELVKHLRLDSETKELARGLFTRLWQMYCFINNINIQWWWDPDLARSPGDLSIARIESEFDCCFQKDDPYGALVCLPSFVRELDGELFKSLLHRKGSLWRLVVRDILSFDPELALSKLERRNTLGIACKLGSVETVRWLLGKFDMRERKRLLTQGDKKGKTPVDYAMQADQKDTIRALGPELLRYWYFDNQSWIRFDPDASRDASRAQHYLNDNFGDLLGLQNAQSETGESEDETGRTNGITVDDQEDKSAEELWQAIKGSLRPDGLPPDTHMTVDKTQLYNLT